MNPPFSAAVHVDRRMADAALRHVASALARLPRRWTAGHHHRRKRCADNPAWTDFVHAAAGAGRVVFSAAIDGAVYAKHGTNIDTRADRHRSSSRPTMSNIFPASPGIAPDLPTLLGWVTQYVPATPPSRGTAAAVVAGNCQPSDASNGPRLHRPASAYCEAPQST